MENYRKSLSLNDIINEHWGNTKSLLEAHNVLESTITAIEYHYKTAFRHGWNHALRSFETTYEELVEEEKEREMVKLANKELIRNNMEE